MPQTSAFLARQRPSAALVAWLASWWRTLHFAALAVVMALSPGSYSPENRRAMALQIYLTAWKVLPWFALLSALFSLVLIRIVVVTAQSYGLSQFALEMVVRVLVVEVLPLSAALFVALRSGVAVNMEIAALERRGRFAALRRAGIDPLRRELLPRVIGSAVAVGALVAVTGILALVLAYFGVYGASPWGIAGYTRTVGQIFDPIVGLGFALKTVLFAVAVATIPVAASIESAGAPRHPPAAFLGGTLRLFVVLIAIEAASLAVKFI